MIEAILFDKDGTLINSSEFYYRAISATFRHFGVELSREEYTENWMTSFGGTKATAEKHGLADRIEDIRKFREPLVLRVAEEVALMPYALELLDYLSAQHDLALVTADYPHFVKKQIERLGIAGKFAHVVAQSKVIDGKSVPDPYLKCIDLLGLHPSQTVAVEDSPAGAMSAKMAGCKVIYFPNGFTKKMKFELADRIIGSLDEIDDAMINDLSE